MYGDGCRVQLLALPSLERTGDDRSGCPPRGAVSPDGSSVARCSGDDVELFAAAGGPIVQTMPGCIPAWRPDGVLTAAHERSVVRFVACGRDTCTRTLISRAELERAARRHPTVPDIPVRVRALVDGIAWLSNTRAAVLLSIRVSPRFVGRGALSAIAFFENGRADAARPYLRTTGGRLAASPRGTYVTQTPDVILRGDGSQVSLPRFLTDANAQAHAFAWSDNERFLAVATRYAVTILDVGSLERHDRIGSGLRSVTLPLRATELAWR